MSSLLGKDASRVPHASALVGRSSPSRLATRAGRETQAQRTEQVTVLDVAGTIASAKLVTPGWTDYMTLSKSKGEWKILSVVQRIDN